MEEPKYPIFDISVRWLETLAPDDYEPSAWQTKDAPDGMVWNSTSFYKAYKEGPQRKVLVGDAHGWWSRYKVTRAEKKETVHSPIIVVLLKEYETWWLSWFQHATFDVGQTDQEAVLSFASFVDRKMRQGREEHDESGYYLMGAEDRYRWHGAEPDGKPEDRSDPPCRCEHCKKLGLIRIAH